MFKAENQRFEGLDLDSGVDMLPRAEEESWSSSGSEEEEQGATEAVEQLVLGAEVCGLQATPWDQQQPGRCHVHGRNAAQRGFHPT